MSSEFPFLASCTSGGCGAKIGPGELHGVLDGLPQTSDERLLVGFDASDDAAVYRLSESECLISTVDFFSPMVDDAYRFGRIAAANAMSDVWAMGGRAVLALNLVCFPESMDKSLLANMLAGGAEKIAEAGAVLGGGHSIYDREPKYGLAVTGLAAPDKIIRNNTPRAGDALILTKALGVGIVMAAHRAEMAEPAHLEAAVAGMERLNRYAAEKMAAFDVSACTDVTGFGLLIHLLEMCAGGAGAVIFPDSLPVLPGAEGYAKEYLLTAAGQRNRNHFAELEDAVKVDALPFAVQELLFDPQTSGGLLMCVKAEQAEALLAEIQKDDPVAAVIGRIKAKTPDDEAKIRFE